MKKGKINIGIDFVLMISILYCLDTQNILFLAIAAAIIHELGHVLAIKLCGGKIESVHIGLFGAVIKLSPYPFVHYWKELCIAAAGPIMGILSAYGFARMAHFTGGNDWYVFAGLNLILSIFNLLPAYPLDGGRILKTLCMMLFREDHARKIGIIGNAISAAFAVVACFKLAEQTGFSLSLTVFCVFVAATLIKGAITNETVI